MARPRHRAGRVTIAVLAAAVGAPGSAHASVVSATVGPAPALSGLPLLEARVAAAPGEANRVDVVLTPDALVVTDLAGATPGAGCRQLYARSEACALDGAFATSVTVEAGDGDDTVRIGEARGQFDGARVRGGPGADTLVADRATNDGIRLEGDDGDDTLLAGGGATLDGGTGDDELRAAVGSGATDATIDYANRAEPIDADLHRGVVRVGRLERDTVVGHMGRIVGGRGDDRIVGSRTPMALDGGPGDDTIVGGAGVDSLSPGTGDNVLRGGGGDDLLGGLDPVGAFDRQDADGGPGDDTIEIRHRRRFAGTGIRDRLRGGAGADRIRAGDHDLVDARDRSADLVDCGAASLPQPRRVLLDGRDRTLSCRGVVVRV